MEKQNGMIYAILIVMMLFCWMVSAEITVDNNYKIFYIGDSVTISGTNAGSNVTYISSCVAGDTRRCTYGTSAVQPDNMWSYTFPGLAEFGAKKIELWQSSDGQHGFSDVDWMMMVQRRPPKPEHIAESITLLTTGPVPNYTAKISNKTFGEQMAEEGYIKPTPTEKSIPIIMVDYSEKIAALEKQLEMQRKEVAAQKGIIDLILEFLHLK